MKNTPQPIDLGIQILDKCLVWTQPDSRDHAFFPLRHVLF